MGKGLSPAQAFAESLLLVNAASRAHATVLTARAFLTRLEKLGQSPLSGVLTRVAGLWGLYRLNNELGDFAGSAHFSSEQINFRKYHNTFSSLPKKETIAFVQIAQI